MGAQLQEQELIPNDAAFNELLDSAYYGYKEPTFSQPPPRNALEVVRAKRVQELVVSTLAVALVSAITASGVVRIAALRSAHNRCFSPKPRRSRTDSIQPLLA